MDILRGTFEHCTNVPPIAMFKSTPRANTKRNFCYKKDGVITEDVPVLQDKDTVVKNIP